MMLKLFLLLCGLTYSIDAFAIGMTIAVAVIGLSGFAATAVAFAINIAVSVIISKVLAPSMPSIDCLLYTSDAADE